MVIILPVSGKQTVILMNKFTSNQSIFIGGIKKRFRSKLTENIHEKFLNSYVLWSLDITYNNTSNKKFQQYLLHKYSDWWGNHPKMAFVRVLPIFYGLKQFFNVGIPLFVNNKFSYSHIKRNLFQNVNDYFYDINALCQNCMLNIIIVQHNITDCLTNN